MKKVVTKAQWMVQLIESELGWGQHVDDVAYFPTKKRADAFVKKYNAYNNKDTVPAWYMYATEPKLVELT